MSENNNDMDIYDLLLLANEHYAENELTKSGECYLRILKLAEQKHDQGHEAVALINLGQIYYQQNDFDKALIYLLRARDLYKDSENPLDEAATVYSLGKIYFLKGELNESLGNFQRALELYEHGYDPLDKAATLFNLGRLYHLKKEPVNSMNNFLAALEIYEQETDPYGIVDTLQEIYKIDPDRALNLALKDTLNCFCLSLLCQAMIDREEFITGKLWLTCWQASIKWWKEIQNLKDEGKFESSIYEQSIQINQLLESLKQKITPESILNFLVGANDLSTDMETKYKNLRDNQKSLKPIWFIEIPLHMRHGEKYLKIRLNNFISENGGFMGYPSITGKHQPVARVKVKLETQWLQKVEIDHIFYPKTKEEHEEYKKNPQNCWLKDIVIMDLGNQLKKEENLELTYSIQVFFDAKSETPDIITTTKRIVIPVFRKNNLQNSEKFFIDHNNTLAFFLAVWSISISFFANVKTVENFVTFLGISTVIEFGISLTVAIALISIVVVIWLLRKLNNDKLGDKIHE
ncbi:MAG: tetratricopeptide repeat protein [Candidatus Odinarchaeota archaeon]